MCVTCVFRITFAGPAPWPSAELKAKTLLMQLLPWVVRLASACRQLIKLLSRPLPEYQDFHILTAAMVLFTILWKLQQFSNAKRRLTIKASQCEHARGAALRLVCIHCSNCQPASAFVKWGEDGPACST